MVVLLFSVVLLQIWITAGSECGLAPTVTLTCANGSTHVDWVASKPGCQNDCKAHWTCTNGTDHYNDKGSEFTCPSTGWDFSIPWNNYFCTVTVFYINDDNNKESPRTVKNCSHDSGLLTIEPKYDHFEVGKLHEINCTLYTVISDNVNISWIGPDGDIANDSRITVIPTTTDGHIHTSTLQFSYISEEDDNTSYNCTASLFGDHESSKSFTINILTFEIERDDYSEVGRPYKVNCIVNASEEIYPNIMIGWIGPDGVIGSDSSSRITVTPTTTDGYIHTSTLQFSYISEKDENTSYSCTASLSSEDHEPLSKPFIMTNLTIPAPIVSVIALDDNKIVGKPFSMQCNVTVVKGIISSVNITWSRANGTTIRVNDILMNNNSENVLYRVNYTIPALQPNDNNTQYYCTVVINNTTANDSIIIDDITFGTDVTPSTDPSPTPEGNHTPTSNNSDFTNEDTFTNSAPVTLVISVFVTMVVIVFTVGLIIRVICKGKRIIKCVRAKPQDEDETEIVPPIDDNYTVQYKGETSTIDYEYLKNHDKMKKWLEMPALDEECSSICAPSVTNETMLDYVVNGCNTKAKTVSTHDTDYCDGIEGYNKIATIKNDTGYYSGSSESLTQENGSYISEKAAFSKTVKPTCTSVQEKDHLESVTEEVELVQRTPSLQNIIASPIPTGYVTLEGEQLRHMLEIENNRHEDHLPKGTTPNQKFSFSNETSIEENNKSPVLSEGDYFPYTTAEIQPVSSSLTSPTVIVDDSINSPVISEGEYLPYTSAVNQYDPAAETRLSEKNHHLQQNCATGVYNAITMPESVKEGTLITDSFPYVTLSEDNPSPHPLHASTDKVTTIDMNGCDASCPTDVPPHSESYYDVFPSATMEAQDVSSLQY